MKKEIIVKFKSYKASNIINIKNIPNSKNIPLDLVNQKISSFRLKDSFYMHCAGGYRSMIAASLLKRNGIHNFTDIKGGFNALKRKDLEISVK